MTTFAIPVRYDTFLTYYPAVTKTDVTTKAGTKKLIGLKDPDLPCFIGPVLT